MGRCEILCETIKWLKIMEIFPDEKKYQSYSI